MSRRYRNRGRNVQGILLLDKPVGISSNDALQKVKRLFNARKAGHTGSLDKLASGLLPICMGEATKISSFLLNADKRYVASVRMGQKTTTADAEGEIISERPIENVDSGRIEAVLEQFRGDIEQIPPMHSAIKQNGQRLYKLAHQGQEVEREPRPVTIYELKLLDWSEPELRIEVHCSKGTYIRTLAEDIGEALGCGAHVSFLRRIGAGPYDESNMVTLEQLAELAEKRDGSLDAQLLSIETALVKWPDVSMPSEMAYFVKQGQPVMVPHAPTNGWVRLYSLEKGFFGIGEVLADGRIAPRRLINA